MSYYPSLPARAHLEDLFTAFPKGTRPLLEFHDVLLRGESALSIAERELIAAYVSALNACEFCLGAHRTMAMAFGVAPEVIDDLIKDVETADIDPKLRPILAYVRKVTHRNPILAGDARAVFDAGWTEDALHDAIMVCCLFNFMNRLVDGSGLSPKESYAKPTETDLSARRNGGYLDWGKVAGFVE